MHRKRILRRSSWSYTPSRKAKVQELRNAGKDATVTEANQADRRLAVPPPRDATSKLPNGADKQAEQRANGRRRQSQDNRQRQMRKDGKDARVRAQQADTPQAAHNSARYRDRHPWIRGFGHGVNLVWNMCSASDSLYFASKRARNGRQRHRRSAVRRGFGCGRTGSMSVQVRSDSLL